MNSCLLFTDRKGAEGLTRGDIDLAFCSRCAFVFNAAWRHGATSYTGLYEETQVFSLTYTAYQRQLAEHLVRRYDLFGKEIVEIGCGKGAFLSLLCELGGNSGVGYDPSFVPERSTTGAENVTFRREYFSENTDQPAPDFICCRMTLEHIANTRHFVQAVRRIASLERGTIVFFQVPDVRRILTEGAFWDVYYEHCSYFSPTSLGALFRIAGFDILEMTASFDDQYLTIEARPAKRFEAPELFISRKYLDELSEKVAAYPKAAECCAAGWAAQIRRAARAGARVILWGSGSKAVAFLAAAGVDREISYLVDINPHRWGKFVPGTGKQIMGPEYVSRCRPDLVIAMNPIYRQEIAEDLDRLGCRDARLYALGDTPSGLIPGQIATPADIPLRHPDSSAME